MIENKIHDNEIATFVEDQTEVMDMIASLK